MSLQDKLDAFRARLESGGPPFNAPDWIHEPMHRATQELVDSGIAGKVLKTGDKAPAFTLNNADGHPVSSTALLAQGPLVVTFYRGVWCPYCNIELQAIEEALPEILRRGAKLVAISPQSGPYSARAQRENRLSFPILSDPRNELAARFGLRFTLPDYLSNLYKTVFNNDLAVVNDDPSWTLPMPARFVLARDGTIVYSEFNEDYTRRPDPHEMIPVLSTLWGDRK
jgi:peroxiredoxin